MTKSQLHSKAGFQSRAMAARWAAVTILLFSSALAVADIVPPSAEVGESPTGFLDAPSGHKIDLLTGFVSFRNVDMIVPGNGGKLPIVVSRVHDINRSAPALRVPQMLGNWDLEIPRITAWRGIKRSDNVNFAYSSSPQVWSNGYCNNPVYRQGNSNPRYDLYYWTGLKLDIPDSGSRSLLFAKQQVGANNVIVYPNIISITGTKGNPKYITTDNWRAECIDLPQGPKSGFLVYAPNGTKYTFDKFSSPRSTVNTTKSWWHSQGAYVYPSRVEDVNGNYLTYEYESDDNEGLYVSQIVASDGRRVRFTYESVSWATHPFWKPRSNVKRLRFAEQLSDDGSTVLEKVEYLYYIPNNPGGQYSANGTLAAVKMPDGRYWNYDYEDNKRATPGGSVDQWSDFLSCEAWSPSWFCLPTYSTYPARLIGVSLPEGVTYHYHYIEYEGHFSRVNARAFSAAGYSNKSWWLDKYEVDFDLDGNNDIVEFTLDTGGGYRTTVDYPWGRRDVYTFWASLFAPGSIDSHARFSDPRASLMKSHSIYDTTTPSNPVLLQQADFDWRRDHIVGDDSAECWIEECDKPQLWNTVLLSKIINLNGQTFTTIYSDFDEFGQPRSIDETGTRSRSVRVTYKNDTTRWIIGNVEKEEALTEGAISRTFGTNGEVLSTSIYGQAKSYEYHPSGDLHKVKWQRTSGGPVIANTFTDYKRGVPRGWQDPLGNTAQASVNDTGTLASETDRRGNAVGYVYDLANRLRFVTRPSPYVRTAIDWYWYHPREIREVTGNRQVDIRQDQHARMLWTVTRDTSLGSSLSYQEVRYDKGGRVIFEGRPASALNTTSGVAKTYDALERPLTARDTSTGHQISYCYGPSCNAARPGKPLVQNGYVMTDSEGYETIVNFESFGSPSGSMVSEIIKQEKLTPQKYITTSITRNLIGQIKTVQQGGITRTYEYYPNKLLYRVIEPESGTTTFTYDLAGNVLTNTVNSAPSTTYVYNDRNQVRQVSPAEPGSLAIDLDYDPHGNLKESKQGDFVRTATYDVQNQVDVETLSIPGGSYSWKREYDGNGGLRRMTYPSKMTVTYTPNAFGQPTQAIAQLGSLFARNLATNIVYTPGRQINTFNYGNGLQFARIEDARGLVRQLRVRTAQLQSRVDLTYDYDGRGNVVGITDAVDSSNTKVLGYDGMERLTSVTSSGGAESFTYDDVGNLRTMIRGGASTTLAYDVNNRLASTTAGKIFQYDARANIASNGSNTFLFDAHNQLRELGGPQNRVYAYDGSKFRVLKRDGRNDSISMFSLGGALLGELDRRTGELRETVYMGRQALATVSCSRASSDADGDGIPNCFEVRWGLAEQSAGDASSDPDGDGVTNIAEYQAGTDPRFADSDGDGIPDGYEIRHRLDGLWNDAADDLDRDRVSNLNEYLNGTPADFNPATLIPILEMLLN
jgi:YD repeat-containing protein